MIPLFQRGKVNKVPLFAKRGQGRFSGELDILTNAGKIAAEIAKAFAEGEFEKFRVIEDKVMESDFDRIVKKRLDGGKNE